MSRRLVAGSLATLLLASAPAFAGRVVAASSGEKYELGRLVGKGGFGRVYKAWKVDVGPNGKTVRGPAVAIKQYASLATAIVEDEAYKAVAELPHLPHAIGDGFDDKRGTTFLVSHWIAGRTLDTWQKAKQPSTLELVRTISKAAKIVGGMNAHGWLHLDLKPQNVMVDSKKRVTVIDIGIAQKKGEDGTVQSGGEGTHKFMAPEQRAAGRVDDRADVFSIAGTLYRLVAHESPVAATNAPTEVATRLDKVEDVALRGILQKGMAVHPEDRYATVRDFRTALVRWQKDQRKKPTLTQ